MFWRASLAGLIGAGLLLSGLTPARAARGDSAASPLVVAFAGGATTLDPIMRSETPTESWQRNIFDTVTMLSPSGHPLPRIVTAWKDLSPTEWQLTLRSGVRFQDGSAMTADDVGRSILDTKNNPKSQFREFASDVSGYKVVNDHTIDVTFNTPDPLFPTHLSQVPVMPEALIAKEGRAAFERHPVGTGPYRFVSWLPQDHLVLETWKGFWGKTPAFRYVRLETIPNAATRLAALLSGQVQVAAKIEPEDFARVRSSGRAYLNIVPSLRTMYIAVDVWRKTGSAGMKPEEKNPFMMPKVRDAVAEAIDVPLIRDKIFNSAAKVASQFSPPGIESYDPQVAPTKYDPAAARKLLAEAGFSHGFAMRLDSPNDRYLDDSIVAQAVGGLLGNIGIKVNVNAIPKAIFFPQINKGDFTMYFAGWSSVDPISTWDSIFHCRNAKTGRGHANRAHYCNPAADALMAKASTTFDDAARIKLERKAFAMAAHDRAYIPLYYQD
ncbi:MAG: ABC transporter substrate-binding protein, partial [Acetobacteraceae bacterium]